MKIETHQGRVDRLRQAMAEAAVSALLVLSRQNVRYLSGFSGEDASLLVLPEEVVLLSDSRFRLQAQAECPQVRLVEPAVKLAEALPDLLRQVEGTVGLEAEYLTVAQWQSLRKEAPAEDKYLPVDGLVAALRRVKDEEEIALLRAAGELSARAVEHVSDVRVVGRTESELALELEFWLRRQGSEGVAFPFIVAHGAHGAKPHATPRNEVIQPGRLLVVDLGAVVEGYAGDITRTFATGPLADRELEMYAVVRRAQAAARSGMKAGMAAVEADGLARRVVAEAGMGDLFEHSLGHGVGLEVHEPPRLGPRSEDLLEVGNVVTVEPGVYEPELGGVRIEDTVVVGEEGATVLTETTRDLVFVS